MGRSPEEGKGYPLQYSDLENSMDHIGHGVAEGRTQVSNFHFRETNRSTDTNDAKPRQDTVNTVRAT